MLFRRPAKPRPRKREALSAQQTETGGGLTPMLYLERWGNMTNRLTPSRLSAILQAADDGDITEQHVLFTDMEDRCEHLAAEIGKRKRALLTLDWEILPGRAKDKRAELTRGPNCGRSVGSFTRTAQNPAGFRAWGFSAPWRGRT